MAKTKIEFEVEIPEEYVYAGEYREARPDELYMYAPLRVERWAGPGNSCSKYVILREVAVWKQLTPEKALNIMLSKLPVTLRHKTWGKGSRTVRQTIEKLYRVFTTSDEVSIDMPDQAIISNVEYLEEV